MSNKNKRILGTICFIIPALYYFTLVISEMVFNIDVYDTFLKNIYVGKHINIIITAPYILYALFFVFIFTYNKFLMRWIFYIMLVINAFYQMVVIMGMTTAKDFLYFVPHIIINILLIYYSAHKGYKKEMENWNIFYNILFA